MRQDHEVKPTVQGVGQTVLNAERPAARRRDGRGRRDESPGPPRRARDAGPVWLQQHRKKHSRLSRRRPRRGRLAAMAQCTAQGTPRPPPPTPGPPRVRPRGAAVESAPARAALPQDARRRLLARPRVLAQRPRPPFVRRRTRGPDASRCKVKSRRGRQCRRRARAPSRRKSSSLGAGVRAMALVCLHGSLRSKLPCSLSHAARAGTRTSSSRRRSPST